MIKKRFYLLIFLVTLLGSCSSIYDIILNDRVTINGQYFVSKVVSGCIEERAKAKLCGYVYAKESGDIIKYGYVTIEEQKAGVKIDSTGYFEILTNINNKHFKVLSFGYTEMAITNLKLDPNSCVEISVFLGTTIIN